MKAKGLTTAAFLGMLLVGGLAKAQNAAPAPMPQGEKGKAEWIKANPDAYRQMGGQLAEEPTKADLKVAAETKKPEPVQAKVAEPVAPVAVAVAKQEMPWGAPENKDAWIASHPQEYATQFNGNRPSTVAAPWGAPENKAAWKAAHPAEFEALNNYEGAPKQQLDESITKHQTQNTQGNEE